MKQIRKSWLVRYVRVLQGFVGQFLDVTVLMSTFNLQKAGNNMSGSEMQREKEKVAAKMREKQAAGRSTMRLRLGLLLTSSFIADAKKAAEGDAAKK